MTRALASRRVCSLGVGLALLAALIPGMPHGLEAQSSRRARPARPDTLAQDTLAVDSTLIRLRERLQLLNRAPGADSALAEARADSMRLLAEAATAGGGRATLMRGAAPELPEGADLYQQLVFLPGYVSTDFEGQAAEYVADTERLYLYGDSTRPARVAREGEELRADSLIEFDQGRRRLEARGNPVFIPATGDEVRARILYYNLDDEVGAALEARSQWDEGANWIVTGDLPEIRPELAYGHDTMFTSCELDEPHYHFATEELKIVRGSVLVARPVRLYFGDVPVAWLPFIAQSLNTGRASGLLTPRFSVNDIVRSGSGYRRRVSNVGFYWAMSEYADATLAMDWFDNTFTSLTGSVRYRWAQRFLQGTLNLRQFWRAEGGTELTLNTAHSWEISERMSFRARGAYASSTSLVRQNSFNPLEVTQSIDSEGGLSRRFDWGNLTVNGNRRQFLSDDRVVTTFPSVNLSLKTLTLLSAPANRARWFNNLTLGGSGQFSRTFTDQPGDEIDTGDLKGALRSSLNLGNLAVSGQASFSESSKYGVPLATDSVGNLLFAPGEVAELGARAFHDPVTRGQLLGTGTQDIAKATITWSTGIDYQQTIVGSTTISPRITLSGEQLRNDTSVIANQFVSGPTRLSFGAELRGDLYGFFPGFAGYDRIRHKVSPSFTYDYSPEVTPTDLQAQVFGSSVQQPRNVLTFGFNQTFEAKKVNRSDEGDADPADEGAAEAEGGDEAGEAEGGDGADGERPSERAEGDGQMTEDGFRRPPRDEIVTLLALRTSAVTYDFVADSTGRFTDGFQTTQITNNITSDFLRGLTINMAHDLFERTTDAETGVVTRRFAPHLQSLNFSFSLNNRSGIFRWLGLGSGGDAPADEPVADEPGFDGADDPLGMDGMRIDESSIVPGGDRRSRFGDVPMGAGGSVGEWNASFSYALNRPRESTRAPSQMLQMNVRLQPTQQWQMTWRTAYDLEQNSFADHSIGLTRELHRWQANFDFVQTATGNWSFRFEVQLTDNQDLKFDYQQRSLDQRGLR